MMSKWNFTNVIKTIPTYVGCNDFPQGTQGEQLKAIISEFINEQFPLLKPDDITQAFKLSAAGKLYENGKKIEPNTYGQFLSAALVGRVLSAYVEYQKNERSRPSGYNPNQLPAHETKPITPAEAHDLILKWCKEDGELPEIAPYGIAYKYLFQNGLVSEATDDKVDNRRALLLGKNYTISVNSKRQIAEKWYTKNVLS